LANVGNVNVSFTADTRNMTAGFNSVSRQLNNTQQAMQQTQSQISFSTIAMGNLVASFATTVVSAIGQVIGKMKDLTIESSRLAIEYENNMMQVDRIFGNATSSMVSFANEQAQAFGMSTSQAIKFSTITVT